MDKEKGRPHTVEWALGIFVSIVIPIIIFVTGWHSIREAVLALFNPPPKALVTINLTNYDCVAHDFHVVTSDDSQLLIIFAEPGQTRRFPISPGSYKAYTCNAGTNQCVDPFVVEWDASSIASIGRGRNCPVSIALTNNNCRAEDFYVDGQRIVSIGAGEARPLQVPPGSHQVKICNAGSQECSSPFTVDWTSASTPSIARESSCP
jgi:hypothetical protein